VAALNCPVVQFVQAEAPAALNCPGCNASTQKAPFNGVLCFALLSSHFQVKPTHSLQWGDCCRVSLGNAMKAEQSKEKQKQSRTVVVL
jgi:hypothetical protein